MTLTLVLYFHVTRGATLPDILAALLDLGAAPSPMLRAVAALDLPIVVRLDPPSVTPPHHGVLLAPAQARAYYERPDVPRAAADVASDALGRLLLSVAEGRGEAFRAQHVDAGTVAFLLAAGVALVELAPARVLASRLGEPASSDARALLEAVAADRGLGAPEPAWRGSPARGRGGAVEARLGVALG